MKDLIRSSKNILILLPEKVCVDTASSALGLAHILQEKDKIIKIGSTFPIPEEFSQILDFSPFETINSFGKKELILSLNRRKGAVKAVRWREIDEKIQFIITPEEGEFEFNDVDLESIGDSFDLVITVGSKTLESAGNIYSANTSSFQNAKILNIDINPKNSSYGTVNKIGSDLSLSSWIMKLAEDEGLPLSQTATEVLFKGILWANEGFRQNETLEKALRKLTSTDSDLSLTISQMFSTLTIAELRYIGKMISNMEIDNESFIRSKIRGSEIQGVNLERTIYPEINIISRVRDYKAVLILIEYEKDKVLVRAYSNDDAIDVFEIFSDESPVGNSKRVTFTKEGDIDTVESTLYSKLNKKEAAPTVTAPEKVNEEVKKETEPESEKKSKKEDKVEKIKVKKQEKDPLPEAKDLPEAIEVPEQPQAQPIAQPTQFPSSPINPIYPQQPLPPVQSM